PGVVSDWPAKCSICNMTLVRRKRGEAVSLPGGVVARMQFSPYRLQLAGIQTSAAVYQPLVREVVATGHVAVDDRSCHRLLAPLAGIATEVGPNAVWGEVAAQDPIVTIVPEGPAKTEKPESMIVRAPMGGRLTSLSVRQGDRVGGGEVLGDVADITRVIVTTEVFEPDLPFVKEGQAAEAMSEALAGHPPFSGRVRSVRPAGQGEPPMFLADVELDNPGQDLWPGMGVVVRIKAPVSAIEPFRSQPCNPPPLRKGEPRTVFICPEHPEVVAESAGKCPKDGNVLERRPLAENQRVSWWCPMHPHVTADKPGQTCRECEGMALAPRAITYSPIGQVLAVPTSAVVDTGAMSVVYVDRGSGMFDGVEVLLGPRCGSWYAVVRGLEPGQRIATTGAFLIDAESRLNPSVAASYFGAAKARNAESVPNAPAPSASAPSPLAGLSPEDQALAAHQRNCPVTGKPLGSMGTPVRLLFKGKTVFLCCEGCEDKFLKNPGKLLQESRK
ncbi:MAG TPA: heavy metal-binding domain-containing protein, partial [Isosphaeraceae bacterium]|nr:heavy metal-binding domain-containing protein [Isosphaeraceae bacterium]